MKLAGCKSKDLKAPRRCKLLLCSILGKSILFSSSPVYYLPQCVGVKSTEKMEGQMVRHRAMGVLCRLIRSLVWKVKLILSECSRKICREKLDKCGGFFSLLLE